MHIRRLGALILLAGLSGYAQQTIAPTPDPVGPSKGDNWTDYNVVNSFETGYRFLSLSGNESKYRSDENFGSGVRLLSSFISVNSKDGHGRLFDELVVTTNGLGGDPYQAATVRLDKNRFYQYNLYWRKNDYLNPGLTTDGGQGENLLNTTYTMQDHNLTLFPESKIRFTLGYTRNAQSGAGISSVQLFDTTGPESSSGNVFPIFSNVKIIQNDFRLGSEVHWHGFTLSVLHGWQDFKDDTPYQFTGSTLNSFLRLAPNHGTSPYWQVGLFRNTRRFNFNGRFTYTGGVRDFLTNENALGLNQFGALSNQQIITAGNARRPVATGNVNFAVAVTPKLTIANRVSVYNVRTEGNSAFLEHDNTTQANEFLYFQYLGIRTIEADTDVQYQATKWLDVHGGYGYSDRRIAASSQFAIEGDGSGIYTQKSRLNTGSFGFRVKLLKGLTAVADGEIGRGSRPFTPKSDQNYSTIAGSLQYKLKRLQLSALTHTDYNLNSVTLSAYSSHSRTYSASASWNFGSGLAVEGTFSKLHVDTLGGIAFFVGPQLLPNQFSYYVSNLYSGTLGIRYSLKRFDVYAGYSQVQDVGDGRSSATATLIGPNLAPFQTAQTFPLRFLAPMGRISFRISERVRWNVGYQYYGYHEDFFSGQNYLAHTGYTSLLWSF